VYSYLIIYKKGKTHEPVLKGALLSTFLNVLSKWDENNGMIEIDNKMYDFLKSAHVRMKLLDASSPNGFKWIPLYSDPVSCKTATNVTGLFRSAKEGIRNSNKMIGYFKECCLPDGSLRSGWNIDRVMNYVRVKSYQKDFASKKVKGKWEEEKRAIEKRKVDHVAAGGSLNDTDFGKVNNEPPYDWTPHSWLVFKYLTMWMFEVNGVPVDAVFLADASTTNGPKEQKKATAKTMSRALRKKKLQEEMDSKRKSEKERVYGAHEKNEKEKLRIMKQQTMNSTLQV